MSVPNGAPYLNGELCRHVGWYADRIEWRPNEPFATTLQFKDYTRGRSAAYLEWIDRDGRTWPMFLVSMRKLLLESTVNYGVTPFATWHVVKHGDNYGIEILP